MKKMCQIIQYFPKYYFPFPIIWSRFSTLYYRVTFRQYTAAVSKKEKLQLPSLTGNFSPFPLLTAHQLGGH